MKKYKYLFVYCVTNSINNKKYIGKHLTDDLGDEYMGSGVYLKKSIEKYGFSNFKKDILEFCETIEELNNREIHWIKILDSNNRKKGYNLTKGGDGGDTFLLSSNKEKTIKSRSESLKKYWDNLDPIQKENRIKKIKGKKRSEESKKKISEGKRGYKMSKSHLENLSIALKKSKSGKPTYNQKKIDLYDINMNFIKTFDSVSIASFETGHCASIICKVCKGKKEKICNHIFKYNNS